MNLGANEREIIINKDDTMDCWNVYTTIKSQMNKIERKGFKAYKEDIINGEVIAKYYKIPIKCVKITKERVLTDEQREKLRQNAKANLAKKH